MDQHDLKRSHEPKPKTAKPNPKKVAQAIATAAAQATGKGCGYLVTWDETTGVFTTTRVK